MQKTNLIDDMSSILSMQKVPFYKLIDLANKCIGYNLHEARLLNEDTFSVDVGLGTLTIYFSQNEIKYRFNPSSDLENVLIDTLKNSSKKPIVEDAEKALISRLLTTYKELF